MVLYSAHSTLLSQPSSHLLLSDTVSVLLGCQKLGLGVVVAGDQSRGSWENVAAGAAAVMSSRPGRSQGLFCPPLLQLLLRRRQAQTIGNKDHPENDGRFNI